MLEAVPGAGAWHLDRRPARAAITKGTRLAPGRRAGVIVLGASIGSGEFLLGPAVFVRYGLSLLWVTTVAVFLQTVINTELIPELRPPLWRRLTLVAMALFYATFVALSAGAIT